jgi:threonine dehydrogenase-like Zn-dependent dehydrogenase
MFSAVQSYESCLLDGNEQSRDMTVADPTLLNPHDAILKITKTAICGSASICTMALSTMEAGAGIPGEIVVFNGTSYPVVGHSIGKAAIQNAVSAAAAR